MSINTLIPSLDKQINVFNFSKTTFASRKYDTKSSTMYGVELNQNYGDSRAFAQESVNRDLGFGDMKETLNQYGTLGKRQSEIKKEIIEYKINNKIVDIFKNRYIELLDRGYTQKNAKHFATQEALKFRDEELAYYNKKLML